ncbi:protoporphyrinogen/coproporphyrinogen oxidase [Gordonia bronchialis]|uniref:protoporphyrinogen/coproporphyrinogen oxidase n=1 Tax=Gordonia bronchialis TaxID=2054 RepID=UPI0022706AA7|nr:FAD-dependent oxidoreductase [Gordonia bronchialis]
MSRAPTAVVGTGFAGFGAGHRLDAAGRDHVVFDRNSHFGGHTASHRVGGFIFDQGPHVSFAKDERVQQILADAVGGEYEDVRIGLDSYWHGRLLTHPVQVNLHGLPDDLIVKVLLDLIDAANAASDDEAPPADYESWLRRSYGDTFAEAFPMIYGEKYHTTGMADLTTDWLGPRMYRPSVEEALRGALSPTPVRDLHYVTQFRYPTDGGYESYLRSWVDRSDVRLDHEIVGIDTRNRVLRFTNGEHFGYDELISSIPLPALIPLIDDAPREVAAAAQRLAFSSVLLVNIGVNRPGLGGDTHIRYVYDDDIPFSRINFPHRLSPKVVPAGTSAVQVEWYFSDKYRPLTVDPDSLIDPTIEHLRAMNILAADDEILVSEAQLARYANVIYDHDRPAAVGAIHPYLEQVGVHVCGRYGEWNHLWTDESFLSGEHAAEVALSRLRSGGGVPTVVD